LLLLTTKLINLLTIFLLGGGITEAVLKFASHHGEGEIVVGNSTTVIRVVSSFNSTIAPVALVTGEGWKWYDTSKGVLPPYLRKYLKS
jgi:hypothetical protein